MKLKMMETDNDFAVKNFEAMCEALERGEGIRLYCWCTGRTRCAMVEWQYEKALRAKYGERLQEVVDENGWKKGYKLAQ